jgi:hypothetical protein
MAVVPDGAPGALTDRDSSPRIAAPAVFDWRRRSIRRALSRSWVCRGKIEPALQASLAGADRAATHARGCNWRTQALPSGYTRRRNIYPGLEAQCMQ